MFNWLQQIALFIHKYLVGVFDTSIQTLYAGNYAYFIITTIAVVLLFHYRDRMHKGYRLFMVFTGLILLIVIFNPLFYMILMKLPSVNAGVVARFWVLCPIWLIVAYSLTMHYDSMDKKWLRIGLPVVTAFVLIFAGSTIETLGMTTDANNIYKVRNESIQIADELLRLSGGEPTSCFIFISDDENEDRNDGETIFSGINQYTGQINLHSCYYTQEQWRNYYIGINRYITGSKADHYISRILNKRYEQWGYEFFALPDNERVNDRLNNLGYFPIGNAGGYNIYRYAEA